MNSLHFCTEWLDRQRYWEGCLRIGPIVYLFWCTYSTEDDGSRYGRILVRAHLGRVGVPAQLSRKEATASCRRVIGWAGGGGLPVKFPGGLGLLLIALARLLISMCFSTLFKHFLNLLICSYCVIGASLRVHILIRLHAFFRS